MKCYIILLAGMSNVWKRYLFENPVTYIDVYFVRISYACLLSLVSYADLNPLKLFILKLLMCDLDCFYVIQSQLFSLVAEKIAD